MDECKNLLTDIKNAILALKAEQIRVKEELQKLNRTIIGGN